MNKIIRQLLPFCSLLAVFILWSVIIPDTFLTSRNLVGVMSRSSVNLIMAAGMTYVIITAGIDLSVGTMMGMCGMFGALAMLLFSGANWETISSGSHVELTNVAVIGGILVGCLCGALCGAVNGLLITQLRLAPFIVTLGTMTIFKGVSLLMNSGKPFSVSEFRAFDTGGFYLLKEGWFFGLCGINIFVPWAIFAMISVLLLVGFLLKFTRFGRYVYAIGSNAETAFHAGVNVKLVLTMIYALTGMLVGLAAMITTCRAASSQPTAGYALELDIIAAVIIGGCSPSGGRGTMLGTIIGTFLIALLRNGLTLIGVNTNWQFVVIGAVIIIAVTADQLATRRKA